MTDQAHEALLQETPILDTIESPADLRKLDLTALHQCKDELRADLIKSVSQTGGHLGAGLGVVELTLALHYVYNTPEDRLIFDVGHQAYPHKILTGRRARMTSLRQKDGLSGFTHRQESVYDPFGTAHSSTAMSAGLGMAIANKLSQKDELSQAGRHVVCVVGDGAMSAGMAYEAMNNAGAMKTPLTVILNDNDMSIARPVGAMSAYLSRSLSSRPWLSLREFGKNIFEHFPQKLEKAVARTEEYARAIVSGGGTLFEELGFYYIGPIDGHNLDHLLPVLRNVREAAVQGPVLVHVITKKGKGYPPAETSDDKYHGVVKFDVTTGKQQKKQDSPPAYTKIFGEWLAQQAKQDDKIVAITAAMPSGTGLDAFAKAYPERYFDVGIAEQHGVTFAAGLACEGFKPFCAIYSTFLQRAYDQVIHDVALQSLPVRFILDRAGYVGADGATHCGAFDLAYLGTIPNMVIMAPSDEAELIQMLHTAAQIDHCPSAIRYPRGEAVGIDLSTTEEAAIPIGKARVLHEGAGLVIVSVGTRLQDAEQARAQLEATHGIKAGLVDARFVKPIDKELMVSLATTYPAMLIVEEGSIGGFSTQLMHCLAEADCLHKIRIKSMIMPDHFIDHMSQAEQLAQAGLDTDSIVETASNLLSLIGKNEWT